MDTDAERVSIAALYHVLKRGILIGEHGNHRLRQKHTVTFAAPVELNGIRGNMAVVVNMKNKKYYVHRVLLPDGSAFKFTKNENANQEAQRGVPERSLANATRSAFNNSIPDFSEKVNTSDQKFNFLEWCRTLTLQTHEKNPSIADIERRKAEFEKLRVYEKTDAEIIINNILSSVLQADESVFSQLENKSRKQAENILYDIQCLQFAKDSLTKENTACVITISPQKAQYAEFSVKISVIFFIYFTNRLFYLILFSLFLKSRPFR